MLPLYENYFESSDGTRIFYYDTPVNADTKGIVVIVHGMAEHGARYRYFADSLFRKKYAAFVLDLRGHGKTGEETGVFGHFADADGWNKVLGDIRQICEMIAAEYPQMPLYIFGHSMGSVLVRCCLSRFGQMFKGAVVCGTTMGVNPAVLTAGAVMAKFEMKYYGPGHPSERLSNLSFGGYNKHFAPNRTESDWLSQNEANVDAYIQDPYCGFVCSSAFYRDMFSGIAYANSGDAIANIPDALPVLLIAGECDPVGGMGREVRKLHQKMIRSGKKRVELTLVPGMRHEILNELNRDETIRKIIAFLDALDKKD